MKFTHKLAVAAAVATAFAVSAGAAVAAIGVSTAPGTAAPPPTLAWYKMTPFGDDPRPTSPGCAHDTLDVPLPPITHGHPLSRPTGSLFFDIPSVHADIPTCWATWSHGYALDVYAQYNTVPGGLTISLPPKVGAFYLYAEPDAFGTHVITATGRDATGHQVTRSVVVEGFAGAQYFGFYNTTGGVVSSITVNAAASAGGFAVGEFGVGNQMLTRIT